MCKLKDSIQVGTLTLSNRLVMPPMASGKLSKDDTVTDTTCTYYGQRAKGICPDQPCRSCCRQSDDRMPGAWAKRSIRQCRGSGI